MTRVSANRPTVLVVDDERDLVDAFAAWLAPEYEVRTAYDGEAALERYDDEVDVVLLDRRMPELSGDEVLEYIRTTDGDCRVAMVTAVDPDVEVYHLGFDDYVVKPVSDSELRSLVDGLVRRAAYDDRVQALYALVSKRAVLEAHNSRADLSDSEEYNRLLAEIDSLDRALEETAAELSEADFAALFRRQDSIPTPT